MCSFGKTNTQEFCVRKHIITKYSVYNFDKFFNFYWNYWKRKKYKLYGIYIIEIFWLHVQKIRSYFHFGYLCITKKKSLGNFSYFRNNFTVCTVYNIAQRIKKKYTATMTTCIVWQLSIKWQQRKKKNSEPFLFIMVNIILQRIYYIPSFICKCNSQKKKIFFI